MRAFGPGVIGNRPSASVGALFVVSFSHDPSLPAAMTVEQIPGGYKVKDANGQSLAYVYGRETQADADIAKVLTVDQARRIASNIAKLPALLNS